MNRNPSEMLNHDESIREARRQRLEKLVAKIRASAPKWAGKAPWQIESLLESGAANRQRELFSRSPGGK